MNNKIFLSHQFWVLVLLTILTFNYTTKAIPSFARQTGLSCANCHTIFPELNAFGRQFKLTGYTLVATESTQAKSDSETVILKIPNISQLSAMMIASLTYTNKEQPFTQNTNVSFPQQFSLFYAGEITPKIGSFIQFTYSDQSGSIGIDNSELRFADQTELANQSLVYGVILNNNPSMQDVWNSTPAWKFPYTSSSVSPSPLASTLIDGGLAQSVAGLGVYGFWNDLIYAEIAVYRSARQGSHNPPDTTSTGVIKSLAPYWRLALQKQLDDFYFQIGTYGLSAQVYPTGISGLTDQYTDIGFDINLSQTFGENIITAHGSLIHESRTLDGSFASGASSNSDGKLNSFSINANYIMHSQIQFSIGYFSITGSGDPIIFAPGSVIGSNNGIPDSNGEIFEFDYLPWLNTKFSIQYIAYNKFNGESSNYDGQGRNASDNNSLYLSTWVAF